MGVSREAVAALAQGAHGVGIDLSGKALSRFEIYLKTLLQWRERLSLTSAATAGALVSRHVLDSLSLMQFIRPGERVGDLGSGAGFPGIPVAIAGSDTL